MMDTEFDVCEEFEIEEVTGVEPYLYEPRRKEGRDGGSAAGKRQLGQGRHRRVLSLICAVWTLGNLKLFINHSRLDCCPFSRLVVPVSELLVTLALSIRLRAARCSPHGRQEVV